MLRARRAWCFAGQYSPRVSSCSSKKLLDSAEDLDEGIDFGGGIVEIKTGASGRRHTEAFHQWLVAMMTAAQGDSALIGDGHHVMRVDAIEEETHHTGPADARPKEPN